MTNVIYKKIIVDNPSGDILNIEKDADVSVFVADTSNLAQIYTDRLGGTLKANPFSATDGVAEFYVAAGRYDVVASIGGEEVFRDSDVLLAEETAADIASAVALQFSTVADMIAGSSQNAGGVDFADYVGRKVSTVYNNNTSKAGGADYVVWALTDYRNEIGDGAWVPDGFINHYVGGGTHVAIFSGSEIYVSQAGSSEGGWLAIQGDDRFNRVLVDDDVVLTADRTANKTLRFVGGVFNGLRTITIEASIEAGRELIFGDSITVLASDGYELSHCLPEWFKLPTDSDDTDSIQKAANFLKPIGGHISLMPSYRYIINSERFPLSDDFVSARGVLINLESGPITIGGDSADTRETAELEITGGGLGIWFLSNTLFTPGLIVNCLIYGPDGSAGNETCIGVRFSDAWGMGVKGCTIRNFNTSISVQFYNYNLWTEGWILEDLVVRRPRIFCDFSRSNHAGNTNTDSFGWGNITRVNLSAGAGNTGFGPGLGFRIEDSRGANVYGISIDRLLFFSEITGFVRFFSVRGAENILTGQANMSIDGFINQSSSDHQILYQRDGGYINLQGRFVHQQGSSVRPADEWRSLCFTEPVSALLDRRCPCSYIGAIVRIGDTIPIGSDGSFTYRLNAGGVYSLKLTAKGDNSFINAEYQVSTYDGNLIAGVFLTSGFETANIKIQGFNGLANHAFSASDGGKIDVVLDCTTGPEDIVWHLDIEQISG